MQAPFYALAIFAFCRQREWIRVPAIFYAAVLLTIMPMVLSEQCARHDARSPCPRTMVCMHTRRGHLPRRGAEPRCMHTDMAVGICQGEVRSPGAFTLTWPWASAKARCGAPVHAH